MDLFAGIPVSDHAAARAWYARLFGSPPSFVPTATEAVWELAEHRYVFIEQRPEHAGHARHLVFVDDLEALVAQIAERGLAPAEREAYANGARKAAYRDPDGNEFGFGGAPVA
jgi:predicted enzyme related to lactoylglutathione lyase